MKTKSYINKRALQLFGSLILIFTVAFSVHAQDKKSCETNKAFIKEHLDALKQLRVM